MPTNRPAHLANSKLPQSELVQLLMDILLCISFVNELKTSPVLVSQTKALIDWFVCLSLR